MSVMNESRNMNTHTEKTNDATNMKLKTLFARSSWMSTLLRIWEPKKKNIARTVAS